MSTREKRMSSGFHTECHRHFVSEAFSGGDGWTGRAAMGPYHTDSVRLSVIEPLTSRHEYVSNVVDRYASPIFRGPQDRRTARRRCAPSASAERARRGLRRRAGILRSPRPCPGEVRDAQTSPGRGTPGQHRGGCLRRQPTGLLHDRSGLRETRDSGAAAASAGAEAQSQVHRRGARLRRTASRRRCQRSAEHRRGGTAPIRVDHSPPLPGPSTGTAQKKIAGDGAPTGVKPAPVDARYVLEQYERLRREAAEGGWGGERGHGLVLFLARGMSSWIGALTALAPAPRQREMLTQDSPRDPLPTPPPSVRAELTMVLAGMVLACSRGEEEAVE
jgi:hypothetical protein